MYIPKQSQDFCLVTGSREGYFGFVWEKKKKKGFCHFCHLEGRWTKHDTHITYLHTQSLRKNLLETWFFVNLKFIQVIQNSEVFAWPSTCRTYKQSAEMPAQCSFKSEGIWLDWWSRNTFSRHEILSGDVWRYSICHWPCPSTPCSSPEMDSLTGGSLPSAGAHGQVLEFACASAVEGLRIWGWEIFPIF